MPEPQANSAAPESGEHFIDFDVREERVAMRAKAERLTEAVGTPAEFEKVTSAVEPSRWNRTKKSLIRHASRAMTCAGVFLAASVASKEVSESHNGEIKVVTDSIGSLLDTLKISEQDEMMPESHGRDNFSMENVEKQREWLMKWLMYRRLGHDETQERRDKMMIRLTMEKVHHFYSKDGSVGTQSEQGIGLNARDASDARYRFVPTHEFSHAADGGGNLISDSEKILLPTLVRGVSGHGMSPGGNRISKPDDYAYVTEPTEFKARLMSIRRLFNLKPEELVDDEMVRRIYDTYIKGTGDDDLLELMDVIKDAESLKRALNEMAANEVASAENEEKLA